MSSGIPQDGNPGIFVLAREMATPRGVEKVEPGIE